MDMLQMAAMLGQGSFGSGFGVGFGSGFAAGIGAGIAIGSGSGAGAEREKFRRQLAAAIETGKISVLDEAGSPMSADSILELLQVSSNPV